VLVATWPRSTSCARKAQGAAAARRELMFEVDV
jgi:hypothetical protein